MTNGPEERECGICHSTKLSVNYVGSGEDSARPKTVFVCSKCDAGAVMLTHKRPPEALPK